MLLEPLILACQSTNHDTHCMLAPVYPDHDFAIEMIMMHVLQARLIIIIISLLSHNYKSLNYIVHENTDYC